jgi:hypothetical protein
MGCSWLFGACEGTRYRRESPPTPIHTRDIGGAPKPQNNWECGTTAGKSADESPACPARSGRHSAPTWLSPDSTDCFADSAQGSIRQEPGSAARYFASRRMKARSEVKRRRAAKIRRLRGCPPAKSGRQSSRARRTCRRTQSLALRQRQLRDRWPLPSRNLPRLLGWSPLPSPDPSPLKTLHHSSR